MDPNLITVARASYERALRAPSFFEAFYDESPNILERIAERHSRRDLDVPGTMYTPFIDALIVVVGRHDPDYDNSVQTAWRETVAPGIDYMRGKY